MNKIIIAIDGVSGSGKSTTAREVARILRYIHIDSGAMYRAITLHLLRQEIKLTDVNNIVKALTDIDIRFSRNTTTGSMDLYMNDHRIESEIRSKEVSDRVSQVSAIKEVREALVNMQQKLGKSKGVVMEGRDIGTVVFPQAELKVFMTANLMSRGERRKQELHLHSGSLSINDIADSLRKRDEQDRARAISPLRKAKDAVVLDTTHVTLNEQVDEVIRLATAKIVAVNYFMTTT